MSVCVCVRTNKQAHMTALPYTNTPAHGTQIAHHEIDIEICICLFARRAAACLEYGQSSCVLLCCCAGYGDGGVFPAARTIAV